MFFFSLFLQTSRPLLFEEMFGNITNLQAQLKSLSAICFTTPDDPPSLLDHGNDEMAVPLQQFENPQCTI